MQTAKQTLLFKLGCYQIELKPFGQKRLAVSIIDPILKAEFAQKDLSLQTIGVSTLTKALEGKKKQIKAAIDYKKVGQNQILSVTVTVQSAFLRPIQETIYLKKNRDVSEAETIQKKLNYLNKKLKEIKAGEGGLQCGCFSGTKLEQKQYNSNNNGYESMCQAKLPKGKYLITFSFILKANNQWLYLYFGSGGSILTQNGFYVSNTTNYGPHVVRKQHTVTSESQTISFNTYYSQSYSVSIRNAIITAKRLSD